MPEELGQENREGQVNFDSADIDKKEKATQFTIIEGEAERAKAAEKAKIAAKKEIEEIHKADVEAAAEIQQEVEKEQRREKGGPAYKIFGGWKKWAIIGCLVVLLGGVGVYFAFLRKPAEEEKVPAQQAAQALFEEQSALVDHDNFEESYPPLRDTMKQAWADASDGDKFWYGYYYAQFLRDEGYAEVSAAEVMLQLSVPQELTSDERCYLVIANKLYSDYGIEYDVTDEEIERCL